MEPSWAPEWDPYSQHLSWRIARGSGWYLGYCRWICVSKCHLSKALYSHSSRYLSPFAGPITPLNIPASTTLLSSSSIITPSKTVAVVPLHTVSRSAEGSQPTGSSSLHDRLTIPQKAAIGGTIGPVALLLLAVLAYLKRHVLLYLLTLMVSSLERDKPKTHKMNRSVHYSDGFCSQLDDSYSLAIHILRKPRQFFHKSH